MRRPLFAKYFLLIATLLVLVLTASTGLGLWFAYRDTETQLIALQLEKATAAAERIEQFVHRAESFLELAALSFTNRQPAAQHRLDYLKILRMVPALNDIAWINAEGHEQLRVSRREPDRWNSHADFSDHPAFTVARTGKTYFGPVFFRNDHEPTMLIARSSGQDGGVSLGELNLTMVREDVSRIRVGTTGLAYVVDAEDTLIAHPDLSLVLQRTVLTELMQEFAADATAPLGQFRIGQGVTGQRVLSAQAQLPALGWHVVTELPFVEAFAPLRQLLYRAGALLIIALTLAVLASLLLARRMARPIRILQAGARQIGEGALDERINLPTGDEFESVAAEFNAMAGRLAASHADLEEKVRLRTRELEASLSAQAAAEERQRILRDMHDGFGSHLLSALVMVEHGGGTPAQVADILRQCIDDLRLVIDALSADDDGRQPDLRRALVMLQTRLEPRLRAAGIVLHWQDAEPDCPLPEAPRRMLSLLRVLQEGIANAVKHGGARNITVSLLVDAATLTLSVVDDGQGFDTAAPQPGRGLTNLQRRATELGGTLEFQSGPTGTCLRLTVPRLASIAGEPTEQSPGGEVA